MINNFEKIKSMTIDEMSKFLSNVVYCEMCHISDFCDEGTTYQECPERLKQWLLSEVENDRRFRTNKNRKNSL